MIRVNNYYIDIAFQSVISEVIPRQKKARRSDQEMKEFRNKLLEVTKQKNKKDDKIQTKKPPQKESESKSSEF